MERTLSIVKPDGVGANLVGEVLRRFEENGISVVALRMIHLSKNRPRGFTTSTGKDLFSRASRTSCPRDRAWLWFLRGKMPSRG